MGTTRVHLCMSVRGALRWDKRTAKRNMKSMTHDCGRPFASVEELREALLDELAKGHEVIPMSGDCDNFDYKTGCRGHPVDEKEPPTPI